MAHFRITHPWSGFVGIFDAETSDDALDAALDVLARAYGYRNARRARLAGRIDAFELSIERLNDDGSTEHVWPHY
mgnify:CR=1 FL=1